MKCKYKELMECFYLTKDNYKEFLDKIYGKYEYKYYEYEYIISIEEKYVEVDTYFGTDIFYFNRYYISGNGFKYWDEYSKEEFEEKFEVIE